MLNKEKYAKEILDIVCETGSNPAIINNAPIKCDDAQCSECKLYYDSCDRGFAEWANSEYKEREIDWNKVPVDTPIYVWNDGSDIYNRYFAGYDNRSNKIIAFDYGGTSWSSVTSPGGPYTTKWENAKIKEGVDCSEWYKEED